MRVLTVNTGTNSLKLAVFDGSERVVATVVDDWVGDDLAPFEAFLAGVGSIDAVGHRVVHGGPTLVAPVVVDDWVLAEIEELVCLAPLHQPRSLAGIGAAARALPGVPAVACFDTAFHAGLPAAARTYALPRGWNERWGLRRYGFHGLSHAHAVRRAAELVGRPAASLRIVSCHLGAGASLSAVRDGRAVDTTMGFTPLEGLVMATRSGTVDPGLVLWLQKNAAIRSERLGEVLELESGLKGLSGTSGDLRAVLAGRAVGDPACTLAYDVFVHRLRREIGAMVAAAGGLDVLVMTGGIGEHLPVLRESVAEDLSWLGVAVDPAANADACGDADISSAGASVRTVVVTAQEDREIARETVAGLLASPALRLVRGLG